MRYLAVIASAILIATPVYADSLGSAVGGTAGNQSSMAGGLCQGSPTALSNGQQAGLLIDCTTHALITEGAGGGGATTVTQSANSLIGVKGADGSTITSTTNPVPTEAVPSNAASVALTPCVAQGVSTLQCGTAAAKNAYVFYLTATADSWLMIFNTTTTPTNGSTTAGVASGNMEDCVKVPSGTTVSIGGLPIPKRYSVGAFMAISSTACATLTLATTGLLSGLVQ